MTHNNRNNRLLEISIHVFCWILFFGFPIIMAQSDNGSINWKEFLRKKAGEIEKEPPSEDGSPFGIFG